MTTNKVVEDGKSEAEVRGLVQIKANELVRRVLEGTLDLEWVVHRLQTVIDDSGGLVLEWSLDFGEYSSTHTEAAARSLSTRDGGGWRLPSDRELCHALKYLAPGRVAVNTWYWSSTVHSGTRGIVVARTDGREVSIAYSSDLNPRCCPHLRLCRPRRRD